jgi:hypothetical protein
MAALVTVSMVNAPLLSGGVTATNAALDHMLKQRDDKKRQEAGKVDPSKF